MRQLNAVWSFARFCSRFCSSPVVAAFGAVAFVSLLVAVRVAHTEASRYAFLWWNLTLAVAPLVLALVLRELHRRRDTSVAKLVTFLAWFVFFPNAPYVVTDLIHLAPRKGVPVWYDATLLFLAGLAALRVGLLSLDIVRSIVKEAAGVWASRLLTVSALGLSGVALWMGRHVRLNSWDVLRPHQLVERIAAYLAEHGEAEAAAYVVVHACFVACAWWMLRSPAREGAAEARAS